MTNTFNGQTTPAYMAPEMILGSPSTPKVDMWALGVILYRFFTNKLPFESDKEFQLKKLITETEQAPLPSKLSPFVRLIIAQLLNKNPENRPDSVELLNKK
jgi:eukaryotic-like serine/threonine-protein kinase